MARVVRRCGFAAWRDTLQETGHRRLTLSLEDVGRSMAQDSASAQARPAADLRTTAGGDDAFTCRGVTTVDVRATRHVYRRRDVVSASRSPRADDPAASLPSR